ncbi:transposase [Celeribacter sp.]|uniref:transposase n=1 Tax=Celeribacter sp. TaxID=1890673 RepID=UPI003A938C84
MRKRTGAPFSMPMQKTNNQQFEQDWGDLRSRLRTEFLNRGSVSEQKCEKLLMDARWPDGMQCCSCGSDLLTRIPTRNTYKCKECDYQQSLTAGSIFHSSHKPLTLWFEAAATLIDAHARERGSLWTIQRFGEVFDLAYISARRIRGTILDDLHSPDGILEAIVCVPFRPDS